MTRGMACLPLLVASLLIAPCGDAAASAATESTASTDEAIRKLAEGVLTGSYSSHDPGLVLLVRRNGATVMRSAQGLASLELSVPLTPDSLFAIGSVTKMFTAVEVLKHVESGSIALSDPLKKFFPSATGPLATVTVEQMLSHTSGIPDVASGAEWMKQACESVEAEDVERRILGLPLAFAPGSDFAYSSANYILLTLVLERVSGLRYCDLLARDQFRADDPAGVVCADDRAVVGRLASGYQRSPRGYLHATEVPPSQLVGAGQLFASADGIARWLDALEGGRLISPAMYRRMVVSCVLPDGRPTRHGLGIQVTTIAGATVLEHYGDMPGYSAHVVLVPEKHLQVIALANAYTPSARLADLTHAIVSMAVGAPWEPDAAVIQSNALGEYCGVYTMDARFGGDLTVERVDGGLVLHRANGPLRPLRPTALDTFSITDPPASVAFVRDGAGTVSGADFTLQVGPVIHAPRAVPADCQPAK